MIILGIDPGIAILGYGIVRHEGNKFTPLKYGAITTDSKVSMPERLGILYRGLDELIKLHNPNALAVEELFFNKNVKTALTIGHARGVVLLAGYQHGLNTYEYTPLQVKQAVVGYGRAEKQQIQQMVKVLLNLEKIPKPDDVADALAVAICHGNSCFMGEMFRIK